MNVSDIPGSVEPVDAQVITGRLYWRSRRGLLELELLLAPFLRECYADLAPEARRSFARLLEFEDVDIYDWLQGRSQPPDEPLVSIVALIGAHNASRGTPAGLLRSEDGAPAPD
ncbi:MAG: succinate dehydrogenase assembly factor 2 [Gammaproteobacteria bacterium]|nr:succinate dehydrogenase assembly factor 2 [Gammaproteobacteria bacterium]